MMDPEIEAQSSSEQLLTSEHSPTSPLKYSDPFSNWEPYRDSKIEVKVGKPVLKEELFTKFFVYKIRGTDLKGVFDVSRRYSDFEKVRQLLVKRWPGCFIPSLPPKKLNNTTKALLEDRTKHLNFFCSRIASIPHLHYSDVYQAFLRTRIADIDTLLHAYQKVKYEDIIERYTVVFSHLADEELSNDTTFKIIRFGAFLHNVHGQFEKFKKIGKSFTKARKNYTAELLSMHNMMADDYEKNVFAEYHGVNNSKHVFYDPLDNKSKEGIEIVHSLQKEDSITRLYDWIKYDYRDIEAFREAFAQKEKYERKTEKAQSKQKTDAKDLKSLSEGKVPLKMIFKARKNKDKTLAQIEDKVANTSKDAENLAALQDLIALVLAHQEIDKFKESRVEKYHEIVGQVTKHEQKTFNALFNYWGGLLNNENIKALES